MTDNRFSVDYAKLGTSACKKCKTKIAKGEIRIAKITPSPFSEGDTMKIYHHVACMFDTFLHARATTKIIESSTDLDGWLNITPLDREIILEHIKRVLATKANKSPTKKPTKSAAPKQTTVTPTKKIALPTEDDGESVMENDEIEIIEDTIDLEEKEDLTITDGVHVPLNDDPKHSDNSFRQFRALCTKLAETNGHLAKSSIVQEFITYGSDGESYKGMIEFHVNE
jgi:DNA ligase-3